MLDWQGRTAKAPRRAALQLMNLNFFSAAAT